MIKQSLAFTVLYINDDCIKYNSKCIKQVFFDVIIGILWNKLKTTPGKSNRIHEPRIRVLFLWSAAGHRQEETASWWDATKIIYS